AREAVGGRSRPRRRRGHDLERVDRALGHPRDGRSPAGLHRRGPLGVAERLEPRLTPPPLPPFGTPPPSPLPRRHPPPATAPAPGRVERRPGRSSTTSESTSASTKLGMLAPNTEFHSGYGSPSHSWNTVRTPSCHPGSAVGTLHWYSRNPASQGSTARHRNRGSAPTANRSAGRFRNRKWSATNTPNSGTNTDPSRNRNCS